MEYKPFRLQVPSGRLSGPILKPVRACFGFDATVLSSRGRLGAISARYNGLLAVSSLRCRLSIKLKCGQMRFGEVEFGRIGASKDLFSVRPGIGDNGSSDDGLTAESGPLVSGFSVSLGYALIPSIFWEALLTVLRQRGKGFFFPWRIKPGHYDQPVGSGRL
jgi:hypothetical protein